MSSGNSGDSGQPAEPVGGHDQDFQPNGHLPERVAEIAGQLSEAQTESRRRRLARQIPELASRSGDVTLRGLMASRDAAWHGMQQSGSAAARRIGPARDAAAKRIGPSRQATVRGLRSSGDTIWRGVRSGSSSAARRVVPSAGAAARVAQLSGQWLAGQVLDMAPKVPVRSQATLHRQYPDLDTEQLARQLIDGAARASGGVGAAVGTAAAIPFVPTTAVELGVETLALVAVELKLIAELHEVYGMPAPGTTSQRMRSYVGSWASRRGVRITSNGLAVAVGTPVRRQLERRLLATAGRGTLALAPLMAGAAAGAVLDYRETRRLGTVIRDDLRKQAAQREQQSVAVEDGGDGHHEIGGSG
ncbi:MAG TPA: hypothetical protein VGI58_16880 [Streptosporangiaceae bacterium]|jgi:hypothetical protein